MCTSSCYCYMNCMPLIYTEMTMTFVFYSLYPRVKSSWPNGGAVQSTTTFLHWLDSAFVSKWSHTRKTGKSPKQYYVICGIVIMLRGRGRLKPLNSSFISVQQLKFGNLLSCSISYDMFQKYISIYGVKWCYCLATLDRPNHCLWKS